MNMEIHNFNTRYNTNLHSPISNFTKFQKGAYYSGTQILSPPSKLRVFNKQFGTFSYCPEKGS